MFSSIACSKADSVALFLYRWRHRRHSLYRLMFVSEFFILHFLGWFSSPWTIGHSPCSSIYMLFFHTLPVETRTGTVRHIRRIVKLPEALLCVPLLGFFKGKLKDKHVKISAPYLSGTCTSFIICNGTSIEVEGTFLVSPPLMWSLVNSQSLIVFLCIFARLVLYPVLILCWKLICLKMLICNLLTWNCIFHSLFILLFSLSV